MQFCAEQIILPPAGSGRVSVTSSGRASTAAGRLGSPISRRESAIRPFFYYYIFYYVYWETRPPPPVALLSRSGDSEPSPTARAGHSPDVFLCLSILGWVSLSQRPCCHRASESFLTPRVSHTPLSLSLVGDTILVRPAFSWSGKVNGVPLENAKHLLHVGFKICTSHVRNPGAVRPDSPFSHEKNII